MTRHQIVRMRPARHRTNSREPIADLRVIVPIDADLVVEVEIADEGNVGDREAITDDETPVFEMMSLYWPFLLIAWGVLRLIEVMLSSERQHSRGRLGHGERTIGRSSTLPMPTAVAV